MFVAVPISIRFKLNENKHTVSTSKKFHDYVRVLSGDVKAVIADYEMEAKQILFADVKKFILLNYSKVYPNVSSEDFELTYNTSDVKDGKFWSGREMKQYHILS